MRQWFTALIVLALAAACATPGLPPGGPTESAFPRVIATKPDTNSVNARPDKVLLRYDDVIGEQANGGDLSRSVLISPWDGEPRVEWRRTGMTIRPKGAWRTNTAYTITVIPGIADLKGTPSPNGYVLRFSTGSSIPTTALRGVTFDWVQGRPLAKTTVLALSAADTTLAYLTVSDSSGRFELGAVPPGTYLVRAIDERNPNRQLDPREPWDTATVSITDSARTELYLFVHDTIPARINDIRLADSVTIAITMDKPLMLGTSLPVSAIRVVAPDSTEVGVSKVLTDAEDRAARERADSLARATDTTQRARDLAAPPRRTIDPLRRRDTVATVPPPVSKRASPSAGLVITLAAPLKAGTTYRVTVSGARNLMNVEGTTSRQLTTPKAIPLDTTRAVPLDSTKRVTPPVALPTRPIRPPR